MKKAGVLGYPVSHSLSPSIHGYWLREYGIEAEYGLIERSPQEVEGFLRGSLQQGYCGFNITIPYKEKAFEYISQHCEVAAPGEEAPRPVRDAWEAGRKLRAVNTVARYGDGVLMCNTDVAGFAQNLSAGAGGYDFCGRSALVLGAGGAARAVVLGLLQMGASRVIITNRTESKARAVASLFGDEVELRKWEERQKALIEADIAVNTTSLGMGGKGALGMDFAQMREGGIVTDIVYTPLVTPFLFDAAAHGHIAIDGLGMLLHQAAIGFYLWFGVMPEVTEDIREKILRKLENTA